MAGCRRKSHGLGTPGGAKEPSRKAKGLAVGAREPRRWSKKPRWRSPAAPGARQEALRLGPGSPGIGAPYKAVLATVVPAPDRAAVPWGQGASLDRTSCPDSGRGTSLCHLRPAPRTRRPRAAGSSSLRSEAERGFLENVMLLPGRRRRRWARRSPAVGLDAGSVATPPIPTTPGTGARPALAGINATIWKPQKTWQAGGVAAAAMDGRGSECVHGCTPERSRYPWPAAAPAEADPPSVPNALMPRTPRGPTRVKKRPLIVPLRPRQPAASSGFTRNHAAYSAGRNSNVSAVATIRPPMIATAIEP